MRSLPLGRGLVVCGTAGLASGVIGLAGLASGVRGVLALLAPQPALPTTHDVSVAGSNFTTLSLVDVGASRGVLVGVGVGVPGLPCSACSQSSIGLDPDGPAGVFCVSCRASAFNVS